MSLRLRPLAVFLLAPLGGTADGLRVPIRDWVSFHPEASGHGWVAQGRAFQAHFAGDRVQLRLGPAQTVTVQFLRVAKGASFSPSGRETAINRIHGTQVRQTVAGSEAMVWRNLYRGVDLVFEGSKGGLKSEFRVAPDTAPGVIRFRYPGESKPLIDGGDLIVRGGTGGFRELAPEAWQDTRTGRATVNCEYEVHNDGSVGFRLGQYDPSLPLIIDPQMEWSTVWGGSLIDAVTSVAIGSDGAVYAAGWTESADLVESSSYAPRKAGLEAFVVKLTSSGSLAWATYLGGGGYDKARGIAVDGAGNVWVAGQTDSRDFPVQSAFQSSRKGGHDAFLIKLDPSGRNLLYGTYLGGASTDTAAAVAVDAPSDAVFVAGETSSADFPVASAYQPTNRGGTDAFVARFTAAGVRQYSTLLGGSGADRALAIAVRNGEAFVTGATNSANFPLHMPLQTYLRGGQDAFVTKLSASGASLVYSTFLGGTGTSGTPESGYAIAVNAAGEAHVAGTTSSVDFPVKAAVQRSLAGSGSDGFVVKLNSTGSSSLWATFLGGLGNDKAEALAIDANGNVHVAGTTWSSDFPVVGSGQAAKKGQSDAFLASLDAAGTALSFSTYLGGSAAETTISLAAGANSVVMGGQTQSADLPVLGPIQSWVGSMANGFITRFGTAGGIPQPVFTAIRVNAGGESYTDGIGQLWAADTGYFGGDARSTTAAVTDTETPLLYQNLRQGNHQYRFAVPNGTYSVRLKFAEIDFQTAGARISNIALNGQVVETDFDIVAAAGGAFRAIDRVYVLAVTDGQITIELISVKELAAINAIEITAGASAWVTLAPGSVTLGPEQRQQFVATVTGSSNTAVLWSLSPAGTGTISAAGLYTAPRSVTAEQTVTITAASEADPARTATATVRLTPPPASAFTPIRVNVGGPAYTDPDGQVWAADTGFVGGYVHSTQTAVTNTTAPALYQNGRYGTHQYRFTVPNGRYSVRLKFAELHFQTAGRRICNIALNGQVVETNFDAIAAAGAAFRAVDRVYTVMVTGGEITIDLISVKDFAKVNALEISAADGVEVAVTLAPGSIALGPGQQHQFVATVTGAADTAVRWAISPAGSGNISATGLYTAPSPLTAAQTVTITAIAEADGTKTAAATIRLSPPFAPIRVNAGGGSYTDPAGQVWAADTGFVGGNVYARQTAIANTTTPALYQDARFGTHQYRFTVPNGTYSVRLKFAEIYFQNPGIRICNIVINGQTVETNFDAVAAAGGAFRAVDRVYTVAVTGGQIVIDLVSVKDLAKISAIEIW